MMQPIAFLGGSFDPIHDGHLWMAYAVKQSLHCTLKFMPTPLSPLKQTRTSTRHRVAMLRHVLRETPFTLETTELLGPSPASSIDTFLALRQKYGYAVSFIFIIGQDSLDTLPDWKGGFDILKYTHLWIFPRAHQIEQNIPAPIVLPNVIQSCQVTTPEVLLKSAAGSVFVDHRIPPLISSTQVRNNFKQARHLVPKRVFAYSSRAKLYGC